MIFASEKAGSLACEASTGSMPSAVSNSVRTAGEKMYSMNFLDAAAGAFLLITSVSVTPQVTGGVSAVLVGHRRRPSISGRARSC